jgi:hypothetical protein
MKEPLLTTIVADESEPAISHQTLNRPARHRRSPSGERADARSASGSESSSVPRETSRDIREQIVKRRAGAEPCRPLRHDPRAGQPCYLRSASSQRAMPSCRLRAAASTCPTGPLAVYTVASRSRASGSEGTRADRGAGQASTAWAAAFRPGSDSGFRPSP